MFLYSEELISSAHCHKRLQTSHNNIITSRKTSTSQLLGSVALNDPLQLLWCFEDTILFLLSRRSKPNSRSVYLATVWKVPESMGVGGL